MTDPEKFYIAVEDKDGNEFKYDHSNHTYKVHDIFRGGGE